MADLAQSIFGDYVTKELQIFIDESASLLKPAQWPKYFKMGPSQGYNLDFASISGTLRSEAAASIVSRDGVTPYRDRGKVTKVSGEIPAIREQIRMSESDYRNFFTMQNLPGISEREKVNQLLDLLFADTATVLESVDRRLEIMCFEAMSTGKITVSVTNNPDGVVFKEAFDFNLSAWQKRNASVNWGTSATAKPITDITDLVNVARPKGIKYAKMIMTTAQFIRMAATTEVQNYLTSALLIPKGNTVLATLPKVNQVLSEALLPTIEILDYSAIVSKDGQDTVIEPFDGNNVVFLPSDNVGIIYNALAIEEAKPVKQVSYAKGGTQGKYLVSKYSTNEPFAEHTKVEFNGFPGMTIADKIGIISTTAAF